MLVIDSVSYSVNPAITGQPVLISVAIHEEVATWANVALKTWGDIQAITWEMVRLKDF